MTVYELLKITNKREFIKVVDNNNKYFEGKVNDIMFDTLTERCQNMWLYKQVREQYVGLYNFNDKRDICIIIYLM